MQTQERTIFHKIEYVYNTSKKGFNFILTFDFFICFVDNWLKFNFFFPKVYIFI